MTSKFEVVKNNKNGSRVGILHTRAGDVLTPTFMPDGTRGAVKGLLPAQVKATGVQVVLANTYHLHLMPGEATIKNLGGLHEFTQFKGPILTDSGGFQVFSLGNLRKITEEGVTFKHPITGEMRLITPEKSIQIQMDLGSDMIVAFDHLIGLKDTTDRQVKEAFDRTHRWLQRSADEFKRLTAKMPANERPLLFGVVQGGLNKELRRSSLETIQNAEVDAVAIGGLSVGESRHEMHEILDFLAPLYDPARVRFLLGVGDPIDVRYAIEHGIDMLDCVMPTRNARHATIWIHKPCTCTDKSEQVGLDGASRAVSALDSLRSSLAVPRVQLAGGAQNNDETSSECKACGGRKYIDSKVHMTNAQFIEDAEPMMPGCDCYACSNGFSRGFLRHQFKVGEPLAGSLASIHNLRYLSRLCESYRNNSTDKVVTVE